MIKINPSQIRQVRSKLKVSPTAFEESLTDGLTMEHVCAVDVHRANFLEASIRAGADLAADTLIGDESTGGFKSATIVVPMGDGCVANVVIKPHKGAVGVQVKADTTLTSSGLGILSGTEYLAELVQNRLKAAKK